MRSRVAVIGAGINGLSTAVQIQEALPYCDVTIIANKFDRDTISDGAAGLFRPTMDYVPGVPRETLKQWCKDSWEFYSSLAHAPHATDTGVGMLSGYQFFRDGQEEKDPIHREVTYFSRQLNPKDFNVFPGTEDCKSGLFFTTVIIECRWFLPWLMKRFKKNGGLVEARTVGSFSELTRKFDIIVNCAGGGTSDIVRDDELKPIRGQMIRVKAPWIKHFLYVDHNCWIIPGKETVTIGGTRQIWNTNQEVSPADREEMWSRACKHMPSLTKAEWQWEWVGMRPFRTSVRVDKEVMTFGDKTIAVVHNYGQGGNGVGLSWGCSKHAARLVYQHLTPHLSRL